MCKTGKVSKAVSLTMAAIMAFSMTACQFFKTQAIRFPFSGRVNSGNYVFEKRFLASETGYYEITTTGIDMYAEVYKVITDGEVTEKFPVLSNKGISLKNIWSGYLEKNDAYTLKLNPADENASGKYTCSMTINNGLLKSDALIRYNAPVLAEGMTPVYWGEHGELVRQGAPGWDYAKWFDYSKEANRWANVELADGSMFVWIPRFAYNVGTAYSIDTKFIENGSATAFDGTVCKTASQTIGASDYIVHPAFTAGGEELAGLWVAKFKASGDGNGKAAFKPGHAFQNNDTAGIQRLVSGLNADTAKYGLNRIPGQADVHLMKNSEWSAVTYLSTSLLDNRIVVSNASTMTGGGAADGYISSSIQSTTFNESGVYDMASGSYEFVSAYHLDGAAVNFGALGTLDAKYKDVFNTCDTLNAATRGQALLVELNEYIGNGVNWTVPGGTGYPVFLRGSSGKVFSIHATSGDRGYLNTWRASIWVKGTDGAYPAVPVQSDDRDQTVLTQTDAVLTNPYQGFMNREDSTIFFKGLYWSLLEPQKGVIDENYLNNDLQFNKLKNQGANLIVRLYITEGGDRNYMPEWLVSAMDASPENGYGAYKEYGDLGRGPHYDHSLMKAAHESLIKRLGALFNNDPFIAGIQLGSIGVCGEWNGPMPKEPSAYVHPYRIYFSKKQMFMRSPNDLASKYGFGIYYDMLGTGTHYGDLYRGFAYNNGRMVDSWKTRFSHGEFGGQNTADGKWEREWLKSAYIDRTVAQIRTTHISFLAGSAADTGNPADNISANADRLSNTMGYRLWVSEVKANHTAKRGSAEKITLKWKNSGCAPFYYDWDVKISLLDAAGNEVYSKITNPAISGILPGAGYDQDIIADIPANLPAGKYTYTVSIMSPYTNKPGVMLANAGQGTYALSAVTVGD